MAPMSAIKKRLYRRLALIVLILSGCGACNGTEDDTRPGDSDDTTDSESEPPDMGGHLIDFDSTDRVPGWHLAWLKEECLGCFAFEHDIIGVGENLYSTGNYSAGMPATWGAGEETETQLTGQVTFHLASHGTDGRLRWVVRGGPEQDAGDLQVGVGLVPQSDGSVIVSGTYNNKIVLALGEPEEVTFTSDMEHCYGDNVFLASYLPDGRLSWARSTWMQPRDGGTTQNEYCDGQNRGLAVDQGTGDVFITGHYRGELVFDREGPSEQTIVSTPADHYYDAFLARYSSDGEFVWARGWVAQKGQGGGDVAVGADGTVYLLGWFEGTVVFGDGEENETSLTAKASSSLFLTALGPDGTLRWARDLGIDGYVDTLTGKHRLLSLANGDLVISGVFGGTMFGGDGDGAPVEIEEDGVALFLARYTPDGTRLWNRISPTTGGLSGSGEVAELADGSLAFVGGFDGTVRFATGEPNETFLGDQGGGDSFLALLDAGGHLQWALGFGDSSPYDAFGGVTVLPARSDHGERILVTGCYSGTVTFGTGGGDEVTVTSNQEAGIGANIVLLAFERDQPVDVK